MGAHKITTPFEAIDKLQMIYDKVNLLITRYQPTEMAIESPFFGKNVQSMLKLGRAQGVSIAAGLNSGLRVTEYSPKKIKKSITGNGNASKEQVASLLKQFVKMPKLEQGLDASDALATAICHYLQNDHSIGGKKFKDWKSFANQHSDRVRK
ncbi:UNVERIFIED_CONTAM: hypothetical protein GTU68_006867 [Idotea baltica]|nr:hypothetical protein [Idotea baltica]